MSLKNYSEHANWSAKIHSNIKKAPMGKAQNAKSLPSRPSYDGGGLATPVFDTGDIANMPLPELLAPAGSREALEAAVAAGADAVYLGGNRLNARMMARNFDDDGLRDAIEYCHSRGVRVYVTLNTLVGDRMLGEALEYAGFLHDIGADAIIIADMGLASLIAGKLPAISLHASTQASCHNSQAVRFLSERGFSRVVCARELGWHDIAAMTATGVEIEAFVHGALCACHSGQCLMSSVIGGRSGNRGECAQPCRLPYNGKYPLSLRDLCLAGHIPELISLRVSSLKIEGRMKSPEYVGEVVSVYRKLFDERRSATSAELDHLAAVFSRGGFTDGYFAEQITQSMLGVRSDADKAAAFKRRAYFQKRELPPIVIETRPTDREPLKAPKPNRETAQAHKSARFLTPEGIFKGAKRSFDEIYLPLDKFRGGCGANGVLLPSVICDHELDRVYEQLERAKEAGARHALIGNIGHIKLAQNSGLILHGDFRLNVCNCASLNFYAPFFEDIIVSPELTLPQIRDLGVKKSVIVYGRLPLMLLEKRVGAAELQDRRGVRFPVVSEGARDIVLNSCPIMMPDRKHDLDEAGALDLHFVFTIENAAEAERITSLYERRGAIPDGVRFTRIARK